MPLILAVEPDRRQTSRIAALAKNTLHAELVAAETTEGGVAALGGRIPDLILTSLLLSRRDESALADWLRDLDAAGAHVPTLVIPVLGSTRRRSQSGGLLNRLTGKASKGAAPDDCDPAIFAAQITEYLERAADERRAAALAVEDDLAASIPVDRHQSIVDREELTVEGDPSPDDCAQPIDDDSRPSTVRFGWHEPAPEARLDETALIEEPEAVTVSEPVVPVVIDEPVVPLAEPEPEAIAMLEPQPEPGPERMPEPPPEPLAFDAAPEFSEAVDAASVEEEEISLDASWDEIVLEEEESDHGVELTSEAIDLEKFVAELNASVVSEFVEALEVLEATHPSAVVEDEPARPGVHSEADSDLWMPLSLTAAWPQLEGGVAKPVPVPLAAPAEPSPAPDRGRRKKASAHPVQDEWGLFDPDQCGFAALLAKLDEITR